MKKRWFTVLSGLLIIALFYSLLLPGCDSEISSFTSLTDLAKMAPRDTGSIYFINVKNLRSDSDFNEMFEEMKESFEYETGAGSETGIMDFDQIHHIGMAQWSYNEVIFVDGDISLGVIRDSLEFKGYDKDDYLGVEIWYGVGDATAIRNGIVFFGAADAVEKSIEAIVDPEMSAYEANEEIREVVGEMPSGLFSVVIIGPFYPGTTATGMSFSKANSELMRFSGCFKFESDEEAEDSLSNVEDDIASDDFYNVEIKRSGNLIKFSAEIEKEEVSLF